MYIIRIRIVYRYICMYVRKYYRERNKEKRAEEEGDKDGYNTYIYVSRYGATRIEISRQEYECNGQSDITLFPVLLFSIFPSYYFSLPFSRIATPPPVRSVLSVFL